MMPRPNEVVWTIPFPAMNYMMALLAKQPYEQVADLIQHLNRQTEQQLGQEGRALVPPPRPNGDGAREVA